MPDFYPIVEVQEDLAVEKVPEDLGSKRKFWYRPSGTDVDWLFKSSRENTGLKRLLLKWLDCLASRIPV